MKLGINWKRLLIGSTRELLTQKFRTYWRVVYKEYLTYVKMNRLEIQKSKRAVKF